MSKLDKFGLTFISLTSIFIIFSVMFFGVVKAKDSTLENNRELQQQLNLSNLEQQRLISRLDECRLFSKFSQAAEQVGSIPYSPESNCYDHAKLLQKLLAEKNIASSILITPTRDHAFIGVWIEANTGSFIKPGRYDIGEVRDENLKTVCQGKIIN